MRLSLKEQYHITETIHHFDPKAAIYLFGSRVDNSKKGGDIDLLVLSKKLGLIEKIRIKTRLYKLLGEQKIDLIIAQDISKPFISIALEQALLL